MALTAAKTSFGVHAFTAINKTTGLPYGGSLDNGILKVLGSANLEINSSDVKLTGGSFAGPIDVQRGEFDPQITLNVKETPNWLYTLAGYTVTENSAESGGGVDNSANTIGTSALDATTGVASATVKSGSEADLKTGVYFVKVASATTVDVYAATDSAFLRGTDLDFEDGSLKITASALTITASTAVEIPGLGIELTGGSGTIGMTDDDVFRFDVRQPNLGSDELVLPSSPTPIRFTGHFFGQQCSNGAGGWVEAYNCELQAFPLNFTEREHSTSDITISILHDETEGGFLKYHRVSAA